MSGLEATVPARSASQLTPGPAPSRSPRRERPRGWWVVLVLCLLVSAYALRYPLLGASVFPPNLRESFLARPWGIYAHASFGALALALGPFQFHPGLLVRRRALHRRPGTPYAIAAFMTGLGGLYMSIFSYGGMVTPLAFALLGAATAGSTAMAYVMIRRNQIRVHREWMIRS